MRWAVTLAALLLAGCAGSETETSTGVTTDAELGPVQLVQALQEGGLVVYLRHAATDQSEDDAGLVDPDDCASQRNLDERGRAQARAIGAAFRELEIPVGDVLSSEYCRTRDTARIAFGKLTREPDLTGFPNEADPDYDRRVARTRELLGTAAGPENTILVAHTNNLEAAAGLTIDEGDLAVFEPLGEGAFTYLGRIPASAWPQLAEELGPDS